MIQIGDKISVIDDDLEGVVTKVDGDTIQFETTEGFLFNYDARKVVVIGNLLQENLKKKQAIQKDKPKATPHKKSVKTPVFDLHIEKIQPKHQHLSAGHKLQIQLDEAQRIIHRHKNKHYKELVLIHGQGKGVLRSKIIELLKKNNLSYIDADYIKYGTGALLVILKK